MTDSVVTVPRDLSLSTPEGAPVDASVLVPERLVVVQLVRYFGCLPCQDWLLQLDEAAPALAEHGVSVAAVGGSADYQAQWLRDERGVTTPLFLDADHSFRSAVSAQKTLGLKLLNPKGAAAYGRSLRKGFRPQRITRDTVQAPGVVVLDRDLTVQWQHIGQRIGDYPPIADVQRVAVGLATKS